MKEGNCCVAYTSLAVAGNGHSVFWGGRERMALESWRLRFTVHSFSCLGLDTKFFSFLSGVTWPQCHLHRSASTLHCKGKKQKIASMVCNQLVLHGNFLNVKEIFTMNYVSIMVEYENPVSRSFMYSFIFYLNAVQWRRAWDAHVLDSTEKAMQKLRGGIAAKVVDISHEFIRIKK